MGMGDVIDRVIDEMPEDFVIKKFTIANRAEVRDMCLTEYNEAETIEMLWQEGHKEGRQEGHKEGLREGRQETILLNIKNLMDSAGWTAEKAMDTLKIPQDQRTALYMDLSENV